MSILFIFAGGNASILWNWFLSPIIDFPCSWEIDSKGRQKSSTFIIYK